VAIVDLAKRSHLTKDARRILLEQHPFSVDRSRSISPTGASHLHISGFTDI